MTSIDIVIGGERFEFATTHYNKGEYPAFYVKTDEYLDNGRFRDCWEYQCRTKAATIGSNLPPSPPVFQWGPSGVWVVQTRLSAEWYRTLMQYGEIRCGLYVLTQSDTYVCAVPRDLHHDDNLSDEVRCTHCGDKRSAHADDYCVMLLGSKYAPHAFESVLLDYVMSVRDLFHWCATEGTDLARDLIAQRRAGGLPFVSSSRAS